MNNIELILDETLKKRNDYENKYNGVLIDFVSNANELVEKSNDLYQVENSILLNKISLKDYILESELCKNLKANNIKDYTKDELKQYMKQYEDNRIGDVSSYKLALDLYEMMEQMEQYENDKIDYELSKIRPFVNGIYKIELIDKQYFEGLYNNIMMNIKQELIEKNILNDKAYNMLIFLINEIFNYYLYGNKKIVNEI